MANAINGCAAGCGLWHHQGLRRRAPLDTQRSLDFGNRKTSCEDLTEVCLSSVHIKIEFGVRHLEPVLIHKHRVLIRVVITCRLKHFDFRGIVGPINCLYESANRIRDANQPTE